MKYLSHYVETAQTQLFETTGAFFAFSNSQFDEKKKPGVKYMAMGAGMICPSDQAKTLVDHLEGIQAKGISQDIRENGKAAIIQRELANHEAQITMDIDDTVRALDGYNISREAIQEGFSAFYDECIKNDWF